MQLADLQIGQYAKIISFGTSVLTYRKRLIALGLLPGTVFQVARIAPLGDPLEINFRGIGLSLRKHEAAMLNIEVVK